MSNLFSPRTDAHFLRLAVLAVLACGLSSPVMAATPVSGSLTDTSGAITYSAGPFTSSNPSGTAGAIDCTNFACDEYALTVKLPVGYLAANPTAKVQISTLWSNTAEDFDTYLFNADQSSATSSASSADPEVMLVPAADGSTVYKVRIVPYAVAGGTTKTTISLVLPPPGVPVVPQLLPTGLAPRYYSYPSPPALGNSSAEPSIGYNWKTGNGMFIANLQTLKIAFPGLSKDSLDPAQAALPAACDATWTDVSYLTTSQNTLDPILWTNSSSGRTFVSQLSGANSLFAFTDNDGSSWTPGQVGPPNGGPDHQTIGTGPYPAGSQFAAIAAASGFNYATYYCSQAIAGSFCARSDNGGQTFNQGQPLEKTLADCGAPTGALHGHVKVGPDGAVYAAPKNCGALQAVLVSTDAGLTFAIHTIPKTDADTEIDPSVAIDAANRLYHCHVRKDGHAHAQVSDDKGLTWKNDYDLGLSAGLQTNTFPEMVAGDKDRAACAFLGTTVAGNHDAVDFKGVWYPFVSTTYDGGVTWHTVNVSPNDPVQGAGGICNAGTLCGSNRNLADFNEATFDEKGNVIFGYADGCIGACVNDPLSSNSFASKATAVRQVGGRPLFAKFDPVEPAAPLAACLSGNRIAGKTALKWRTPDNGGTAIAGYSIYRAATAAGPFTQVGTASKNTFDDTTVDDSIANYFYRVTASNTAGEGVNSNFVKLPITVPPVVENSCTLPGVTIFDDAAGDSTGGISQTDVLKLSAAELPGSPDKFTLTMKIASLSPVLPGVYYIILTKDAAGKDIYFQADTSTGSFSFTYGTYAAGTAGVLTFTEVGSLDASSTAETAKGNIIFVIKRSTSGNFVVGKSFPADVRVRQGSASVTSRDAGGPGDYTVRGVGICAANTPPLAMLTADVQKGPAPLSVKFGVFGSDADSSDTLASYTLNFGDGTPAVTDQVFPNQTAQMVAHNYTAVGLYMATLTVKDSRGLVSSNTDSKTIEIVTNSTTVPATTTQGRYGGGAMGWFSLMSLGLVGLRRRRKQ